MSQKIVTFQNVSFGYEGAAKLLFKDFNGSFPCGWTGIIGANGAGKTSLLKLCTGLLAPNAGTIQKAGRCVYCQQCTDTISEMFSEFLAAEEYFAESLKAVMGIRSEWAVQWRSLSHGERKRAQIATALWSEPELMALDEPTNHLDGFARRQLINTLKSFKGVGLLVSHDRELLDKICNQCLFLTPGKAIMRIGGYTEGRRQEKIDELRERREYDRARQEYERVRREITRRKHEATKSKARCSKRHIAPKDHAEKTRINGVRNSGKDAVAGNLVRQLEGRLAQASWTFEKLDAPKSCRHGVSMNTSFSERNTLLSIKAGIIPLGEERQLSYPELLMRPGDRIALVGVNGSGKSSLVRHLLGQLKLENKNYFYMPQEIDTEESRKILDSVFSLTEFQLGRMMNIVSRLGSRPEQLLRSAAPSPGELRKMLLATGILREPQLIIMDEPTNHLDIIATECMENVLADCSCALLLASHDELFLQKLTVLRWEISIKNATQATLRIH